MPHNPIPEKRTRAPEALGPIHHPARDHEISGCHFFAQGADGGETDSNSDAQFFQGGDVGAGRDFRGGETVVGAVSGEEGDGDWCGGGGGGGGGRGGVG